MDWILTVYYTNESGGGYDTTYYEDQEEAEAAADQECERYSTSLVVVTSPDGENVYVRTGRYIIDQVEE